MTVAAIVPTVRTAVVRESVGSGRHLVDVGH